MPEEVGHGPSQCTVVLTNLKSVKLLETLVVRQLLAYLNKFGLLQTAYRACQLTETAVLKVLSDILLLIYLHWCCWICLPTHATILQTQ